MDNLLERISDIEEEVENHKFAILELEEELDCLKGELREKQEQEQASNELDYQRMKL